MKLVPGDITMGLHERIVYEDNHLLIVNKRPSEIVQGDKTGDIPMSDIAKQYLRDRYNKPGDVFLGVVHRIDRPVSGVVIFARTSKALSRMNALIREQALEKRYWAVVKNMPDPLDGRLEHYLKKNERQNKSYLVGKKDPGGKQAILTYRVLASSENYHLLEIILHTGRHHQIRAQLSAIGCPIRGDMKYGYPRSNGNGSIHLHARSVAFVHPVSGGHIYAEAPCPTGDPLWDEFETVLISR